MANEQKKEEYTIEELENQLNLKQKAFCRYYVFGWIEESTDEDGNPRIIRKRIGNGTHSYAKAYKKDPVKDENICSTQASIFIRNPKIKQYMNYILEESRLNETAVDARLAEIIFGGKDSDSVQAIKHFNKMKNRVKTHIEHSGGIVSGITKKDKEVLDAMDDMSDETLEKILDEIQSQDIEEGGNIEDEEKGE